MIVKDKGIFYRYFSSSKQDQVWGVDTHSIGESVIFPRAEYPPAQHPESYQLHTKRGRVLNEYQVIFISLTFGKMHYFKNWIKGHDNILKITVTYISENLFLMKELI